MDQSIGWLSPTSKLADTKAATSETRSTTATPGKEVSKDLFLQLMVAQLKNQNPLNPVDGTDFLMQLSQISSVEQMVEMRQQLESIHGILEAQSTSQTSDKKL
jgi:flagellar basal-body rod modification protein FlgD